MKSELITLILGWAFYSALGSLVWVLWNIAAPSIGAPILGLGVVLSLWWIWFLLFVIPIAFFVSIWRASDPLVQLTKKIDAEHKKNIPEDESNLP